MHDVANQMLRRSSDIIVFSGGAMTARMDPADLRAAIAGGLLSFPVTDFDAQDRFNVSGYLDRLHWLGEFKAAGVFPAGGAGEFFSLTFDEYRRVTQAV